SGRWLRGRCAFVMKSPSSNHTLKALVPTLCVAVVVIYGLADRLRNFVASIFIPQYHYPYAVAGGSASLRSVLVSLLALNLLHVLNLVPLKRYSRPLGERVLVSAICNSAHAVLATCAKASSSYAGLYAVTLPLLPIVTAGFSLCLKLPSLPSIHISVLITMLGGTSFVITASRGLAGPELLGYIYAPLTLILHSISMTWLAKVCEGERHQSPDAQASVFDIYYAQLVNQSWVLGLLWLLHPDSPWQVLSRGSWQSLLFHGYLLAILLLGMVLDFLVGMSALCVSPLAASLLHSARQVLQPFFHLL
ncbi:hypothetical protein L3Q82_011957, partial [Scortum barcoo]